MDNDTTRDDAVAEEAVAEEAETPPEPETERKPETEEIPEERIESIKNMIDQADESLKEMMIEHYVIPFMYDERIKDKLILASIDPTGRECMR